MTPETRRLLRRYRILSAVTSIVTHPVPLVDEIFVIPIHYRFSWRLAREKNVRIRDVPWKQVHKIIWGGAGVRFGLDVALGVVPIAGAVAHVLTAVALTEALGEYLDVALKLPLSAPPPVTLQALEEALCRRVPMIDWIRRRRAPLRRDGAEQGREER